MPSAISRITPAGVVTEFRSPCNGCIVTDIAQGPGDVLYFTSNDPFLGRITTSGQFLDPIPMPDSAALAGSLAIHGSDVWITDFNNDVLWRYDGLAGTFTRFPVSEPHDVVVDAAGIVWFTAPNDNAIGRLDPQTGTATLIHTDGFPQDLTIADSGPQGIAAAPDGSVWFTQTTKGNAARITNDGTITEGKAVKGSQPFGITVDALGNPWYTMLSANKVVELQLR